MEIEKYSIRWLMEKIVECGKEHGKAMVFIHEFQKHSVESAKEEIRTAVADYMDSENIGWGEGRDHEKHSNKLGELLDVEKYDDGSGYNFNKYQSYHE